MAACLPGTALTDLLASLWICHRPGCGCAEMAARMDRFGAEWCESNMGEIVGVMRAEARARGLPFIEPVARMAVRRAIGVARRRASSL